MPGETWDSFESSDFYENIDNPQMYTDTAATSTTKLSKRTAANCKFVVNLKGTDHDDSCTQQQLTPV